MNTTFENTSVRPTCDKAMLAEGNFVRPVRVQRKRSKGWKMPENTVYVGRPTKWGNPYIVGETIKGTNIVTTHEIAVKRYKIAFQGLSGMAKKEIIDTLRGKNLACFCSLDKPCHADFLLEIVNAE